MRSQFLRRFGSRFFALGFLAIVVFALAHPVPASADSTTKHVTFDLDVIIGGTKLLAGDYTLIVDTGHLTVKRGRTVVAQAVAHWVARDTKPDRDSVLYGSGDDNQVLEIRFAHQRDVLVLGAP